MISHVQHPATSFLVQHHHHTCTGSLSKPSWCSSNQSAVTSARSLPLFQLSSYTLGRQFSPSLIICCTEKHQKYLWVLAKCTPAAWHIVSIGFSVLLDTSLGRCDVALWQTQRNNQKLMTRMSVTSRLPRL